MNGSIHRERTASEPQDRSSSVAHSIEVPSEMIRNWQEFVNLLAEIMHVPSASIMRADPPRIKVFVSSTSKGNPCEPGALDTGPYCETVMKTGQPLLVPDALENEAWKANPHVRSGMISYLGVPIGWPDGHLFGTICVRDNKRNEYSEAYLKLLLHFRDMLQADLNSLVRLHGEIEEREAKIRRAEQALRESEDKLRQLFETVPGLTWSTGSDASEGKTAKVQPGFMAQLQAILNVLPAYSWYGKPSGSLLFVNNRQADFLGVPKDHPLRFGIDIGAQWDDWIPFLHPDEQEEGRKYWSNCLRTGEGDEHNYRVRDAQGNYRWFLTRAEPLRASDGTLLLWMGVTLDIDEGKKAEVQLRRSEAYLAEAQRLSHCGVAAYNETAILYGSEEIYRIWGFDPAQGVPSREAVFQRVHPDDRDQLDAEVQRAVGEKRGYSIGYRILLPDGTVKHLESIGQPMFSASGDLVEIITTQMDVTERKRAEQALRENEAKIRRLVDANIIGIFIWDFNGRILEANEAFLNMLGYDREDLVAGRISWTDLTPPEWRDRDARLIQEQRMTGSLQPFEKEYFRKDGGRVAVLIGVATFEEDGNQGVAFVLDLTERKRAEERLRVQHMVALILAEAATIEEATLRILRAMGECLGWDVGALWRVDREAEALRCVELWHKASIEIPEFERVSREFTFVPGLGLPGRVWSSLEPEYIPDVIPDENFPRGPIAEREGLHAALGFPILLGGEVLGVIEFFSREIRQPDQELLNVLATIGSQIGQFIERKRAEEALHESERSSRSALDGIAGLVSILAPNGEVEAANRQFLDYFGSLEWVKNWETNDAVHPEDFPRIAEFFKRAMASGIPFQHELRLRRFDGEYRWFENRGVPIRDDSGRIARWYVLLTDIEDRKRALAQLEQMQSDFAHVNRVSMMGELAASLSHEITQPIASARNNARAAQNFLDMQPPDLGEVREALSCVVGDTDRAGDMVDRIRDHVKKAPPRKAQFDLNEAIDEVIVLGRSAIIKNRVWVQTRLSEGLCPVHGDRVQLQQVVLNLLLNAVEAMGSVEAKPRELLINTEQDHTGVLVAVRDSGPGIDPSHLERVFDAFYTTKSTGMGMGLSICRSIIEAHGGRLWAEANEPRGTIFQFTLPAVP
jgi:PAS domain S-box-containing protein